MDDLINKINNAIKWSFYILFFFVPLAMWPTTSELFELNKMWLVFGMTIFIAFLWGVKIVISQRIEIRRTPLDIPIALFLISQIASTIFSIEPHVSLWGYYSRFNGGLFSTISYIFLYYAFASNLISRDKEEKPISYKVLFVSLLSGLAVTLWGIPSHFGADPTCFVFRGTFDTGCWTAQFQPTLRIFSTLGQPNWMGTFLAAIIPITIGFGIYHLRSQNKLIPVSFLVLLFLFFLAEIYSHSQSSFIGLSVGLLVFLLLFVYKNLRAFKKHHIKDTAFRYLVGSFVIIGLITFVLGTPIGSINKYVTFAGLANNFSKSEGPQQQAQPTAEQGLENNTTIQLSGGTESGKIRLIVWQGALDIFKKNPIFGTGVETFAYAYYGVKPLAHNLTSEWDYLYNKAHNEYLNYLATTGIFGLGSYLLIIGFFGFRIFKTLIKKTDDNYAIPAGIVGGYSAILVSNFFGFSVVPINLFFFLFPLFFFELADHKSVTKVFAKPKNQPEIDPQLSIGKMSLLFVLIAALIYFQVYLLNFWLADKEYALGYNLNRAQEPSQAYQHLLNAVNQAPYEDLYKDELSINMATLAFLLNQNNQATQAAQVGQQAASMSEEILKKHPKNVVFYKTNIRVYYALSDLDPRYLDLALAQAQKARELAPTDPKLAYNMGLFYTQKGETEKMVESMNEAIRLKPNYADPRYALALYYVQAAKEDPARAQEYNQKARDELNFILQKIDPVNSPAKELLKSL